MCHLSQEMSPAPQKVFLVASVRTRRAQSPEFESHTFIQENLQENWDPPDLRHYGKWRWRNISLELLSVLVGGC